MLIFPCSDSVVSLTLSLFPNLAHFNYAKFLESLVETGKKQMKVDDRMNEILQEYLVRSVNHYGMALQLSQKHVYHALPRLLALWLEFTSLETDKVASAVNGGSDEIGEFLLNSGLRVSIFRLVLLTNTFLVSICTQPEHTYCSSA